MQDMRYDKILVSEDGDYRFGLFTDGSAEIIKYQGNGVSIDIPEQLDGHTVKSIGFAAFSGCITIRSVKMPGSIKNIRKAAFWACKDLYSVTIPEGVECIGEEAFSDDASLNFIYLPESLKYIGRAAFKGRDHRYITAVVPRDSYAEAFCHKNGLKIQYAD